MRFMMITKNQFKRGMLAVESRAEHPPVTWSRYHGEKDGHFDIIKMEHTELEHARESGNHAEVLNELLDLAAACVCAYQAMTCDKGR